MSETPVRKVRIDDDLWAAVQATADKQHENASVIIRRALIKYIEEHQS